jgi:hypothetical protein
MPNGFRRMPVEAEVAPGDRQICRYGYFLALARSQKGAIVANAQPKAAFLANSGGSFSSLANLSKQGEFALSTAGSKLGLFHPHLMRIGQFGSILTGWPRAIVILCRYCT